ncbi:MAG TPA: hypothetical protein VF997_25170 [Polyangia bacterium]
MPFEPTPRARSRSRVAHRSGGVIAALAAVVAIVVPATAAAALHHAIALAGGGELSGSPAIGGHGFGLVRYDLDGLPRQSHFAAELNTDTLRVSYDRLRLGPVEVGVSAAGEVLIAGLLTDYYRDGRNDPARGFYASYAFAGAYAKMGVGAHFFELAAAARRWFFARAGDTSAALTLPPEAWVGELRLRYTLWMLRPDPSLYQAQRLHARLRGVALGVELGLDERSQASPWGARDVAFTPSDPRNAPGSSIFLARQWLRAGVALHPRVRVQVDEVATWMWNEDDLVRLRVGGFNPYSVPLAGAPWAGYLAGKLAAVDASLHVRVWRDHEVGVVADGVVLDDPRRTADSGVGVLGGVGAFVDARVGAWQLDVRGGWSPTARPGSVAGSWGLFAAAGWAWSR